MTNQISSGAAAARESARTTGGKFGVQAHDEADLELDERPTLDPMTWLKEPGEYGKGWTIISADVNENGTTITHRPDPTTAAAVRELLGVTTKSPVRIEHHHIPHGEWDSGSDTVEITAGKAEMMIDGTSSYDSRERFMKLLAYHQAPPVHEQVAALIGGPAGSSIVDLRARPDEEYAPKWDGLTVQVLGIEDDEILLAPSPTLSSVLRDKVPSRLPLEEIGALDRASAVHRNPALAWSKGHGSAEKMRTIDDADLTRMQNLARAMPGEDWTYRFEVWNGDKEHGVEVTDSMTNVFGDTAEYSSYDFATLDPENPRDRWIIDQRVLPVVGTAGVVAREVAALDHAPDEMEIDEIAAKMHARDQQGAEYARRYHSSARATIPRPEPEEYAGYLRIAVDDFLA